MIIFGLIITLSAFFAFTYAQHRADVRRVNALRKQQEAKLARAAKRIYNK